MTFDEWVKKYSGKAIDYDGTYGVQCVDLVKHYVKNVLGISPQSIGNAIEYYNKRNKVAYLKDNFRWHNNTPDFIPKKGDICVFTSKSGNGHISVATGEGTTSYFYSYDQNYPKALHEPMTKIKHSYNSFLGVLRPKSKGKSTSKYFKAYNGTGDSIVDALESLKIDSSFSNRKKIAKKNQIAEYTGTPRQNLKMLNLLKQGKLLKP